VDLPAMLADSAGKGILIVAVAHSRSQLAQRWGDHGAETIWALTGTKILLPGISDAKTLNDVSDLCGSVNLGEDDGKSVRIVPPELLRALPDWRALVVRMNLSPVVVKFRPAWKRRGYRRLTRRPAGLYVPSQFLEEAAPAAELPGSAGVPEPAAPAEPVSWFTTAGGDQ
jgi:type IV secretion system protein VirD4